MQEEDSAQAGQRGRVYMSGVRVLEGGEMTREDQEIWDDLDDDERLEAYRDTLDKLRDVQKRYKAVSAQSDAMLTDFRNALTQAMLYCESTDGNRGELMGCAVPAEAWRCWKNMIEEAND